MIRRRPYTSFGSLLHWYVVSELFFPSLVVLAGLTALLLTKDLLKLSDLIINRGFDAGEVVHIALYKIIPLATRTLPFAVLIGSLIGLGRLRADLEILALEASGVASERLVRPAFTFAAFMTAAGLVLSLLFTPWALQSLEIAMQGMMQKNPGLTLQPGTVHQAGEVRIVAREVSARGTELRGVFLWLPDEERAFLDGQTIFAESGVLKPQAGGDTQLVLSNGVTLQAAREKGGETRFATFTMPLKKKTAAAEVKTIPPDQLPLSRLIARATLPIQSPQSIAELHRRFSYPVACLVFGLLAVPLALLGSRFSHAAGAVVGLLVTVVYYGLLQLGAGLSQAGLLGIESGVWLPNITVCVLSGVLLRWGRWQLAGQNSPHLLQRWWSPQAQVSPSPVLSYVGRSLLQRYVARRYAYMFLLSFGLLLVGYLIIDVLERYQKFAQYQAEAAIVVQFYAARLPLLVSRVLPMALLLATALTVSELSAHKELIGMRACGVSVARALTPILLVAITLTPVYFALNEYIVPSSTARANKIRHVKIKKRGSQAQALMIWYRAGTHIYHATQLEHVQGEAQELSIYELGPNGLPLSRTDALAARRVDKGVWELVDAVRIEISEHGLRQTLADRFVQLGAAPHTNIQTKELGVSGLAHEIQVAEVSGYNTTSYRVDLHVKMAAPLACLLLPAVALFFAIGGPPFPGAALTILVSIVLGVSYILLTGVGASLGYGGFLSPYAAGWGPPGLLALFVSAEALGKQW